jgi:hypothetical protein
MSGIEAKLFQEIHSFLRFKHTFLSKMSEELSSRHILHEYIETARVLSESLISDLNSAIFTTKGWLIVLKMRY